MAGNHRWLCADGPAGADLGSGRVLDVTAVSIELRLRAAVKARAFCTAKYGFAGGRTWLLQETPGPNNYPFDPDYAC